MSTHLRLRAGSALAAVLLAGCGGAPPEPDGAATSPPAPSAASPPATGTAGPAPSGPATGTSSPPPVTGMPGAPEDVLTGLDVPWSVVALPDGSGLVTLREEARVLRVGPDGDAAPVQATGEGGRVPDVRPGGEGGLLGAAISPTFAEDSLVYLYLTAADGNRVVRARLDGAALGEPEVLLSGIPAARNHNGGRIAFGPDGMLYAGTGDAGSPESAPDPDSLAGKILRLSPGGGAAPGNPVEGSPVWSVGHRNVQGLGWDAAGRMYASEFGSDELDELNLIEPGADYGWPRAEGPAPDRPGLTDPLLTWRPAEASPSGIAVTGDAVYLAALRGERLWRVPLADGRLGQPEALLTGDLGRLRDVTVAPGRDALWVLTNNTARGDPRRGDDRLVRLPLG